MATQNASNQKFTNQADGFVLGGGTAQRNLTVTGANITLTGTGSNTHTFPASSDTLVGRTSTDTLTNKSINLSSNTLTGTTAQFNAALSDNLFATQAGTETLTNKTLSSPTFSGAYSFGGTPTWPTFNQNTTGSAATLTTARTIQTNLASASSASFNGSANITPGVTGTLPVGNGGTGRATATTAYGLIAAGTTATGAQQTISPGTSGQFLKSAGASALASFASIIATDISDSSSVGRSVLTAVDAAAARTAIGAGTGSGDVTLTGSQTLTNKTLTSPVINGTVTGTAVATAATANLIPLWDANKNLFADNFIATFTTTATAAGTTVLTVASTQIQVFTGTSTQTVTLPTTSVVAGTQYRIINNSTGAVTVQSSGANTITILAGGSSGLFTALIATPTTAAHWDPQYWGSFIASGKALNVSNTLTLAGTDGTTMTFPSTSGNVVTEAATQTLSGKTLSSPTFSGAYSFGGTPTWPTFNQNTTGSAATLTTSRNFQTDLASTSAVGFNGSANNTHGVTGTLAVTNGGTGRATSTTAYGIIAAGTTATGAQQTISPGTSGQFLKSAGASSLASFASIVATDISDSSSVGRSVLTAADAAAARAAIGAGTGSGDVTLTGSQTLTNKTLTSPVINGTVTGTAVATTATANLIPLWDANKNLFADNFIATYTTTATAAGTTTLTVASTQIQVFTGATTQTVVLPTTSVVAGTQFRIINNSTGVVTVQSSALNTITILAGNTSGLFTALQAAPTANTHWDGQYWGAAIGSGKTLGVSNTLTLAGTDGTTMTFPATSGNVVTEAATQTLTSKTLSSPTFSGSYSFGGTPTWPTFNQNTTGSAATLTTSRNFQTDLASTSAVGFNGSANNTHGVTGILAVTNGGTGRNTATTAYGLIAAGTTATGAQQTISPGTSGQFLRSAGASALASFASLIATDISDSSSVGRSVLTAADAATARTAIGAGTGNGDVTLTGSQTLTNKTLTSPVINGTVSGTGVSTTTTANTLALRDANGNLSANALLPGFTTTATAAGTTTMTITSDQIQVFTGASTQTVRLPTTGVVAGGQYRVINNSTGAVTVQSSGANTIVVLAGGTSGLFTALQAAPTLNTHWDGQYWGSLIASGKVLNVSNSLTFAGTDGTTMTFPGTSGNVVTEAATQTLTGKTLSSPTFSGSYSFGGTPTWPTFNQNTTGSAATLTTGRTIQTNLASTSGVSFNGSANITPGVTGTLPVGNGGTGATTLTGILKGNGTSAFSVATAGTDYVTPTGSETLTNKTLTTPRISTILDINGAASLNMGATASAVNYIQVLNSVAGAAVRLRAAGTDTNISFNIVPIGTGVVQANGVEVATISDTQTLTNKTLSSPTFSGSYSFGGTPTWPTFNQNTTGSAATLTTARTVQTNLGSTSSASFNGSANITPGVTGTLPVGNGGTGATTLTGLVKGNGASAFSVALAGTDYVTPTGTETLSNKTLTNPTVNNYTEGVVVIGTVTTTHTLNLTNGTIQTATLTASTACTFTMPSAAAGKSFVLMLKQAASTGNGTATFSGVKWNAVGAPTITSIAGKMDILSFFSDGTSWYGSYTQGYTP